MTSVVFRKRLEASLHAHESLLLFRELVERRVPTDQDDLNGTTNLGASTDHRENPGVRSEKRVEHFVRVLARFLRLDVQRERRSV